MNVLKDTRPSKLQLALLVRLLVLVTAMIYVFSLSFAHRYYLNSEWEYFGFTYSLKGENEILLKYILVLVVAVVLPATIRTVGSLVVVVLFVVVYVPTVVISVGVSSFTDEKHLYPLLSLCLIFTLLPVILRLAMVGSIDRALSPDRLFFILIFLGWFFCCLVLVYNYYGIMRLASLEEVYVQRAAGASTSLFMGYVQIYFSNVFSPALIAIGLVWRRWTIVAIGIVGCIIMYLIVAQRTVALIPLVMIGLHFVWDRYNRILTLSVSLLAVISLGVMTCALYFLKSGFVYSLSTYLVFRTIAIPGLSFTQYLDLFDRDGFTYWSHVKGLGSFLSVPDSFAGDPLWPNLGLIVGDRLYSDATHNVNANLFSGDGVAAAGALGVLVIGSLFAAWLFVVERVSRHWDRKFVVLIFIPIALSLSNGHLFTVLLSFGGLFWTVALSIPLILKPVSR